MNHLQDLICKVPALTVCEQDIQAAFVRMRDCYQQGGKVLVCGNGGSAADSEHIVGELMKGFMLKRPLSTDRQALISAHAPDATYLCANLQGALPAISLVSHSALISAFSNDVAPDMVFAQQVYGFGKPGDVFIGISTSGSSANVVYAAQVARSLGLTTIALTGKSGGKLNALCDVTIKAPSSVTPDIQEYHLPIYHTLCMMIETTFFGDAC